MLLKKLSYAVTILLFLSQSCVLPPPDDTEVEEEETNGYVTPEYVSDVDGDKYIKAMQAEVHPYQITKEIEAEEFPSKFTALHLVTLADSLIELDSNWRVRHFNALNNVRHIIVPEHLSNISYQYSASFLIFPEYFLDQFKGLYAEDFDFWTERAREGFEILKLDSTFSDDANISSLTQACKGCDSLRLKELYDLYYYLSKN